MKIHALYPATPPKQTANVQNKGFKTPVMQNDSVNFKGLMPNEAKKLIKLCVYDLDETLLEGSQAVRDKILDFSKGKNLMYSTARPIKKVQQLIDDKTLAMPDYCACNNGLNIYKNVDGKLEEIKSWSDGLAEKFNKEKVRDIMAKIAKENPFEREDYTKMNLVEIPEGQKAFRGSKITEYEAFGSPLNIYFMMAPGVFKKTLPEIEQQLAKNGIEADINFQNFDRNNLNSLHKYFPSDVAKDMKNHALPRLNPDGSVDVAIVTARADKGRATEMVRKELGIKEKEVFASGDGDNDYTNTNKGYFFALISNAVEGLKALIGPNPPANIIKTTKPGVDGIWEVLEP